MAMAVKSLLKGLRYITQIFEEKHEPEMQIGDPTDVKHVAHIGWDGPTANAPSWMNQFKGEGEEPGDPSQPQDTLPVGSKPVVDSPSRNHPKGSKRDATGGSSTDSPKQPSKQPRKKKVKDSGASTSAKTSAKPKSRLGRAVENGPDPELKGG